MRQLISPHRRWQLAIDAAIVAAAWWLAFQLRFDHGPNLIYSRLLDRTILLVVGIKLIVFIAFGFSSRCTASGCRGRSLRSTSSSRSPLSWARASSPARRWSAQV